MATRANKEISGDGRPNRGFGARRPQPSVPARGALSESTIHFAPARYARDGGRTRESIPGRPRLGCAPHIAPTASLRTPDGGVRRVARGASPRTGTWGLCGDRG